MIVGMAHIKAECDNITKLMLLLIVHAIAKGIFTVIRTLSTKMLKKWPWDTYNKTFTIQRAFRLKKTSEIHYNIACMFRWLSGSYANGM